MDMIPLASDHDPSSKSLTVEILGRSWVGMIVVPFMENVWMCGDEAATLRILSPATFGVEQFYLSLVVLESAALGWNLRLVTHNQG